MIVDAKLIMISLAEDSVRRSVEAHRVLQNWASSTITWDNRPMYDETIEGVIQYTGDEQKYITLNITNLVKNWYINGNNFGIMLKDNYEFSGYTEFLFSDCSDGYEDFI